MIAHCKRFLLQRSREWGLPQSDDWHFLFHNNYHPHCSNINVLWFHGRDKSPRVVAKAFQEPTIVRREFENLIDVHKRVPHLVPKPLHFGSAGGFWTLWMEGIPGSRVSKSKAGCPCILQLFGDTVLSMHLGVRRDQSAFGKVRNERVVTRPVETLLSFGTSRFVREGCKSLAAQIPDGWIDGLPVIPQHGDLFFGNLLSDRGRCYILDWETYGITDLPGYDIVTLIVSVLLAQGTVPENWPAATTKQVRRLLGSYSKQFGLSRQDIGFLLPVSLANWFHLQREDGRKEFTDRMYKAIEGYFYYRSAWERLILPEMSDMGAGCT